MEKDYALEQEDKETLRMYKKHHIARTEGREIPRQSLVSNPSHKEQVDNELAQHKEMTMLKRRLIGDEIGMFPDWFKQPPSNPGKMGPGIFEQMKESNTHRYNSGAMVFGTGGEVFRGGKFKDGKYSMGFDSYKEEPETLEELKAQLNFNLVEDIISIEKR